jgi:predicted outer membrane lipoprotein
VRASLTAVVFSIRRWSIEVPDCVMGDSTSLSLVVVLMGRAIDLSSFKWLLSLFLIARFALMSCLLIDHREMRNLNHFVVQIINMRKYRNVMKILVNRNEYGRDRLERD